MEYRIPVVDISRFREGTKVERDKISANITDALRHAGSFYIEGTGINADTTNAWFTMCEGFFQLSDPVKAALRPDINTFQQGFIGDGEEVVRDQPWNRQCYNFCQPGDEEASIWPNENDLPGFRVGATAMHEQFRRVMTDLLKCISVGLSQEADWLGKKHTGLLSVSGLNYYPKIPASDITSGKATRCNAHSELGLLSLILSDSGGLEVAHMGSTDARKSAKVEKDATFIEVEQGKILVVGGHILTTLTNGQWRAAVQRVGLPPGDIGEFCPQRFSIVFREYPDPDQEVAPLTNFPPHGRRACRAINAGEFLKSRRNTLYNPKVWNTGITTLGA